jgi:hypothetical protein
MHPALRYTTLLGALAGVAMLPASALAAAPIALDAPDNGTPPMVAYAPSDGYTYVAWSAPTSQGGTGVDLCILQPGATSCMGGAPVLLLDPVPEMSNSANTVSLAGLVILPTSNEVVVLGMPVSTGTVTWASPPGGAAFLASGGGLQNSGNLISPVSLYYTPNNAVGLSGTDVGLFDSYDHSFSFFSDSPFAGPETPMTLATDLCPTNTSAGPEGNANNCGQFDDQHDTIGPVLAAEPAPPPAPSGTEIVVGVGANVSSNEMTPSGCVNYAATGYGVTAGTTGGSGAGSLNGQGLQPNGFSLLACAAEDPVVASGGTSGIGVLETEGSGVSGAGKTFTLDYRPFNATATGGTFGGPVLLQDITATSFAGAINIDLAHDSGNGVYASWEDHQGLVLDYSSNGGAAWEGPTVVPEPASGPQGNPVIVGTGGGNAEIAYVGNPGIGPQVFLQSVNYAALVAANTPPPPAKTTTTTTTTPPPPPPNSGYTIQSIVSNSNGTVTITFVPAQSGEATLVVTVPTASIASSSAVAAKSKKCKHGQIKIKGKCLPAKTVTGKASGSGTAGVPLKLTVNLSSKIKALLKKGKTVHLTATLTYKSALGGASTVNAYQVTVKGHKPKKKK